MTVLISLIIASVLATIIVSIIILAIAFTIGVYKFFKFIIGDSNGRESV
jgi:hypothetical protein